MDVKIVSVSLALPFGRHKDKPLAEVPVDYLRWALRECRLGSGLRAAVAGELQRRGEGVPAPPPPRPLVRCRTHPEAPPLLLWIEDRLGRRRIRAECSVCRRLTDHPPCVAPYTTEADRNASGAPVLDALTRLEGLGVELVSDGQRVWVNDKDWRKVPADLHATIRQCSNQLARLIGRST
jgi:hypothetical protein